METTQQNKKQKVRPHTHRQINSIKNLDKALEWRQTLCRDIKDRHSKVYDPMLSIDQLQVYNDQLNEWCKELKMWDWNIKHNLQKRKVPLPGNMDSIVKSGKIILGKLYFGRALELPEIKSHLDKQMKRQFQVERWVDVKKVNTNNKKYSQTTAQLPRGKPSLAEFENHWTPVLQELNHISTGTTTAPELGKAPTQKEIESWLVQRRKEKLMQQLNL